MSSVSEDDTRRKSKYMYENERKQNKTKQKIKLGENKYKRCLAKLK